MVCFLFFAARPDFATKPTGLPAWLVDFPAVMHLLIFMSWKGKLPNSQISTKHQNISTIFCSRVCVWLVAALLSYRWQAPSECSNKKNKPSLLCTATATCWQADTLIPNYSVLSTLCRLWVSEACPTGPQHISQGPFVCPCCPSHTHSVWLMMMELKAWCLF